MKPTNLNENELLVMKAIVTSSESHGGDFTYYNDAVKHITTLTEAQVKGYLSQLEQKNYINVSADKSRQIFAGKYVDFLTEYELN